VNLRARRAFDAQCPIPRVLRGSRRDSGRDFHERIRQREAHNEVYGWVRFLCRDGDVLQNGNCARCIVSFEEPAEAHEVE
jgi:hypothetical protein